MDVDFIKENLCINKLVATKKEVIFVESDMIVPDSKPDILNTICTSGVVCIYKKDVLEDKVRIDGCVNTYIMYIADDNNDKVRGLNTNIDFSESIQVKSSQGMNCKLETKLKSIETKVINGRKVGVRAAIEININVYSKENVEIINDISNTNNIQMLKDELKVNSLLGDSETRLYAKETIAIDSSDDLAEILKVNINICNRDTKISYNKILAKSEVEVKIMYLTEDNRINKVKAKLPVVGFIDMPNVSENNICDIDYEIKNVLIKANPIDEHSIYVEIETIVSANVYEEKNVNIIKDLYSTSELLNITRRNIVTMANNKNSSNEIKANGNVKIENIENNKIIDVDVNPVIENESISSEMIKYEGDVELKFILSNDDLQIDTKTEKIPFEFSIENDYKDDNINSKLNIEVANQDFIIKDNGMINSNIDMRMNSNLYRNANLNVIENIEDNGKRDREDYSILMYIVKKDDTLWKIAKKYGTTVEEITRVNGIENENKILEGQKIFIPNYIQPQVNSYV